MKTIRSIIETSGFHKNLQIRYYAWSNIKFFKITKVDQDFAYGKLDSGEVIQFSLDSDFWEVYFVGAENAALAA